MTFPTNFPVKISSDSCFLNVIYFHYFVKKYYDTCQGYNKPCGTLYNVALPIREISCTVKNIFVNIFFRFLLLLVLK